jgi:hypothetical protein
MRRVAAEPIATSWIGLVQRLPAASRYEIGNPLTASKITRHQLAAALYAPLRVVLYDDADGRGIFEYDKPSSPFGVAAACFVPCDLGPHAWSARVFNFAQTPRATMPNLRNPRRLKRAPISQSPVQDRGRKTFALFRNHLILPYRGNVRR